MHTMHQTIRFCHHIIRYRALSGLDVPQLHACHHHATSRLETLLPSRCLGANTVCKHRQGYFHHACAIMVKRNLLCIIKIGLPSSWGPGRSYSTLSLVCHSMLPTTGIDNTPQAALGMTVLSMLMSLSPKALLCT